MASSGDCIVTDVSVTLPDPSVSGLFRQERTLGPDVSPAPAVLGTQQGLCQSKVQKVTPLWAPEERQSWAPGLEQ